jgi:hypothetical protein
LHRRRALQLRIDVCDTGAGIPEDQRQSIFSEFYQLANPTSDRQAGLGVGLAIVDRLSRLLGHLVQLESHPGRGSRFSVSVRDTVPLPVALHAADLARGKRVMVIDDDVLVLDGMRAGSCRADNTPSSRMAYLARLGSSPRPF